MSDFASAGGIEAPGNEEAAVNLVFGKVPHPPYTRDIIIKQEDLGMNDLGPRSNLGVVYHRALGRSIRETGEILKEPSTKALTHYGIGAPPPCEAGEDGDIFMWSDPVGNVAPVANGPLGSPQGDGPAFVAQFGAIAINRDLLGIEISGMPDDPISDTTIESVAAISAYWADQAQIPHDEYPMNPHTGVVFTYFHWEFASPHVHNCPGAVVINALDDVIARTKTIMKSHQTEEAQP